MNTQQIADRVKRQFGDEVGAQIDNTDIIDWINDGQREIVQKTNELLQAKGTANTTNGTVNYALPADLYRLHRVAYKGRILNPIEIQEAEQKYPEKDGTVVTGEPQDYWIWDREINLSPAPNATGTNLTIYYQRTPVDVTAIGTGGGSALDTDLPINYHQRVVDYCIAQAAELDDNDSKYIAKMGQLETDLAAMQSDAFQQNQNRYPFITPSAEDSCYYDG